MSENNENNPQTTGGPAPASSPWVRPAERPRVGRIGDWSNSSNNNPSSSAARGGINTFSSVFGGGGGGGGGSSRRRDDDSDDDEDDRDKAESWFTGGERSGLNVQNPESEARSGSSMVRDIMMMATRNSRERAAQQQQGPQRFTGGGYRLGGDEVETEFIPDEDARRQANLVVRNITFWRNGFQIGDGELRDYDSPEDRPILAAILAGNAPPSLLDVEVGQEVDVQIHHKRNEDYVPPAGARVFAGSGHRLGAPVPDASASGSSTMPGEFPPASSSTSGDSTAAASAGSIQTRFEVDQSLPTTSVQIRLADGTRMPCRMNLTHTVGDIRNFINAARPENLTRPYTIATTFPNRVLDNNAETIEAAKLQNSVVVQRWA